MRSKISAIILTKNEEAMIEECLESVRWVDEIVVVDNKSTDGTLKIVEKFGVKKIVTSPLGSNFADHRNLGAKAASGEWILYIDADERVTPMLRKEINSLITNHPARHASQGEAGRQSPITNHQSLITNYVAYAIPRRNIRLTKELHWGGWWPDYVLRLIKKDKLITWMSGELHEQPKIKGEHGYLKEAFVHFGHRGSFEYKLQNTINWSKIEAQLLYDSKHPPMNVFRFVSAMWREFYKRMFKCQAYRDGIEGVLEAIYQVFSVFVTYARLWEMQVNESDKSKEAASKV